MPLTEQQYIASTNRGGNLLVSAAAGSGKTKVLVERLMEYLKDPDTHLDQFLIITYTKAAAAELRGKIAARLTEAIAEEPENWHLQRQMQRLYLAKISTVHGFCSDVVREYAQHLGLSGDFRVADENECSEIRERVLSDLLDEAYENAHNDEDFRAFVDSQGLGRDDRQVTQIIGKVFDSAMCHSDPEQWLDKCLAACDVAGLTDVAQSVWGGFLMEEFREYLDLCIEDMSLNVEMAQEYDEKGKVIDNLSKTVTALRELRACETWDEVCKKKDISFGTLRFPKDFEPVTAERIKATRDACKKGLEKRTLWFTDDSAQVFQDMGQSAAASRGLIALVRRFRDGYTKAKRARRCVDFGDLEHLVLDLLWRKDFEGNRVPTAAAADIGRRFREIMVDEYQDSNEVQDSIFRALSGDRGNCFMVGDVKQSIYQFRLADPGIFLEKYNSFTPVAKAAASEGRKVLLSANFRSGPEVVEAVNHVFRACMCPRVGGLRYGEDEALREGLPRDPLPDPAVELHCIDVQKDTYDEEAAYVAHRIRTMLDSGELVRGKEGLRPVRPDDIVILLRSPGSVGLHFRRALEELGIRCTSGGGTDLLQTQEIQVLRSILQTISNPRQDIPLLAALASPVFGFTADELAAIRSGSRKTLVYDALVKMETPRVKEFLEILGQLRREARMHSIAHLIQQIFRLTRMDSIYGAMDDGEIRRANLQAFYQTAANYESGSHRDLEQFLDYLELQKEKGLKLEGESACGAVTVMSIHKSKGLEFPVVFLSSLSRGFNQESLRAQVMCHKDLGLGLSVAEATARVRYATVAKRAIVTRSAAEGLSEEMRVLYVAMTRPQDRLIMTFAAENVGEKIQKLAFQMNGSRERLIREVHSPGEWVLLAALNRHESQSLLEEPQLQWECKEISDHPWKVVLGQAPEKAVVTAEEDAPVRAVPAGAGELLKTALEFRYPHLAATCSPSKQTATQRKGRLKDQEAAEATVQPRQIQHNRRKPSFIEAAGKDYGNAMHTVMQYIHYDCCGSVEGVRAELERLWTQRFLTAEQVRMIRPGKIAEFFAQPLGQKLLSGAPHIREFKFSILDNGENFRDDLVGEQVLVQGVVDCALLEEDGITVIDFKTDRVTEDTLNAVTDRYRAQVKTYADALCRIYQKPIKAAYLYFFSMDCLQAVE